MRSQTLLFRKPLEEKSLAFAHRQSHLFLPYFSIDEHDRIIFFHLDIGTGRLKFNGKTFDDSP